MGTQADSAAVALVRAITEQTGKPLPRMQSRILNYLVRHGYTQPRGLSRADFRILAEHYGRSTSLVRHAVGELIAMGAVLKWQDESRAFRYSYNPDWRPGPEGPSP